MRARTPNPPAAPDSGTSLPWGMAEFPGGVLRIQVWGGAMESPTLSDGLACASQCGVQNFKRREKCFKCGVPKSGETLMPPLSLGWCGRGEKGEEPVLWEEGKQLGAFPCHQPVLCHPRQRQSRSCPWAQGWISRHFHWEDGS